MNKQKNSDNSAKEQLLRKLEQVSSLSSCCERPTEGWIRTIRTALNMSTTELGKKTNRAPEHIVKLEEDEAQGKLTPKLKHLQNIGKVFGGRFEYVWIPENIPNLQEKIIFQKNEEKTRLLKKNEPLSDPFLSTSSLPPVPSEGWICTLRYALKISRAKLQKNLNISYPCLQAVEEAEKRGQLVNKTLRRATQVLGYHIEYIFIPIKSLNQKIIFESSPLLKMLQQLPPLPQKPIKGWISTIRNSQGITQAELAERLEITERQVTSLEKSEAKDGLTAKSRNVNLNELAKALGCKFEYILIKDTPLYDETVLSKFKFLVPFPPKPRKGWVSKIRNSQGATQKELAKKVNCSQERINKIERQEARTNLFSKSVQDIIRALKCRVEHILIPEKFETKKIPPYYVPLFEELKRLSALPHRPNDGWIHWLRCSLKMTQTELADRIGVEYDQLSKIEWREAHNQLIDKRKMEVVKALGCRLEYRIVPQAVSQRVVVLKQGFNNELFLENLTKLSLLPLKPAEGWIRTLRTTMGLTQKQLAKKANCRAMNVSDLEDHERHFFLSPKFIYNAARSLGCRVELIFIPEDIIYINNVISKSTSLIKNINVHISSISQKNSEYDQAFLEKFKVFSLLPPTPEEGWFRTLRKASRIFHTLGAAEQSRIVQFLRVERNEISNKFYSQSTKAIAKALKCRIECFLIPENISSKEASLYRKEFVEQLLSLPIRPSKGWIYTMRKALKLSQSELAQRINLHCCSICYKEKEEEKGKLIYESPMQLAQILGFRLEYFFVPECVPISLYAPE
jgi:transcriptional regulator with XRE-family HTH domain